MNKVFATVAELAGVTHRYGKTLALDGVDLKIPAGCMAGIIGPDGVGKSTLLGLVAGARKIQIGSVEVLGGDMSSRRFRAQGAPRIAYMPQGLGGNLYATLSVFENVDFFGRLFGQARSERAARIANLLESTGLEKFKGRPAGKLSGGMKQKLGLCCALIHDPELLILDEPTTGVDPLSRRQFWELIERIRARRPDMSVLVATAYLEEAQRFDWLAALDDGRVLAVGRPDEIKSHAGAATLEEAFISLLPEAKRRGHKRFEIPPRPARDGEAAIEAQGLTMRFGEFTAVDHATFRIERGEIFGFLGSNGCGKTTTMKMLTGLLPASEGSARLFGRSIDARDLATRKRVGYMSQSFSLYSELTVRQNLELHAQLFHVPADTIGLHVDELIDEFQLREQADSLPEALPLGMRQRLSLAVAVVHRPEMLILDEPTSGVDPIARDEFWRLLIDLSRQHGVTIFISTHFMNEGERCDRISLMHAGRVLASDTPVALIRGRGAANLEDAFISYLEEASGVSSETAAAPSDCNSQFVDSAGCHSERSEESRPSDRGSKTRSYGSRLRMTAGNYPSPITPTLHHSTPFSFRRLFAYARRESLELWRDPIRLTFAILGSVLLMFILGYGISLDVEDLRFAVLDRDQTPQSRDYVQNIAASRYFIERPALADVTELDRRMRSGEVSVAIEIPTHFAVDLKRGRTAEIGVWVDGAMPFRGETIKGYVQGLHYQYLSDLALRSYGELPRTMAAEIETRYRYNQDFRSLDAMVPAVIPMLLIFIPAILMAVGVVREKELGSITNLYVTPVTRLEFLLGKQLPYIVLSMASFVALVLFAVLVFRVPLKGSVSTLSFGALLYVTATTGFGLLMSAFSRTQIAALAGTAVTTMLPTIQFSGLTDPVSSLEGAGYYVGQMFPATYFLIVSRGVFTKALGFADLAGHLAILASFIPILTILSLLLLKKQGR